MFRYSLEDSLNRFVTPNESTRVNTLPDIYIYIINNKLINKLILDNK